MSREKILIIEDEEPIRELIMMNLEASGFTDVRAAGDGETGLTMAKSWRPDVILLDLMLPGIDGLTVCRKLKKNPDTAAIPVIMLTAKSEESDVVVGLELGAVDYITKPFSNKILVARIRAQLRRTEEESSGDHIRYKELVISVAERVAQLGGMTLEMTYSEFELIALFARQPGRVFSRRQLINRIQGDDYAVTERAVDVHIVNLRKKLRDFGANIETVRGVGYRLKQL